MKKKNIFKSSRKSQLGLTSVEFFAVLLGGTFLVLAGYFVYTVIISDSSAKVLISGHQVIVKEVRDNYRNATNFSTLNNTVANAANYAPESWETGTATIVNNVNGSVTIAPSTCNSIANSCFTVTQASLDTGMCNDLVNAEFSTANTIIVGTTTVKANAVATINPGTVGAACNNALNSVAIQYSKF